MAKAKIPTAPAVQVKTVKQTVAALVAALVASKQDADKVFAEASGLVRAAQSRTTARIVAAFEGAASVNDTAFDADYKPALRTELEAAVKAGHFSEGSINSTIGKYKVATIAITNNIKPNDGEGIEQFFKRANPLIQAAKGPDGKPLYTPSNRGGRPAGKVETGKDAPAETVTPGKGKSGTTISITREGALKLLANNDAADMMVLDWATKDGLPRLRELAKLFMPK